MKKAISVSDLRANIYAFTSKVAQTGIPLLIERDGVILRIERQTGGASMAKKGTSNLWKRIRAAKLKPVLNCAPEDLIDTSWTAEWNPDDPS